MTACSSSPGGRHGDLGLGDGGGRPGAGADAAPPDLSLQAPLDLAPDLNPGPYPAGPYGNQLGETLADFSASGYPLDRQHTDPLGVQWGTLRLSDYHAR